MTRHPFIAIGLLTLAISPGIGADYAPAREAGGAATQAFRRSVEEYVALRDRVVGALPALESSWEPGKSHAAVEARSAAIRAARSEAQQGDVFTHEVGTVFRHRISAALADAGYTESEALLLVDEESDSFVLPVLAVNGPFPWVFGSMMLPCVLEALPSLPAGLEYRFVHTALVLVDVDASLIVDILPAVFRELSFARSQ